MTINPTNENQRLAALALQKAQGQVGQAETPRGSNRGKMVDIYLRSVGLSPGYAWCQAFVYWCLEEAAKSLGRANPAVKTAGVVDCWIRSAGREGVKRITAAAIKSGEEMPRAGDQLVLVFGAATGHTCLVERVSQDAKGKLIIQTIEGNSNANGGREGYEVVRRIRGIGEKGLKGFIRYE